MLVRVLFPINAEGFTYEVPEGLGSKIGIGVRVLAPFRRGKKIGIVIKRETTPHPPTGGAGRKMGEIALKPIEAVLDGEPLIPEKLLDLMEWVGQYYISTAGLALKNAVPSGVLEGKKGGKGRICYDEEPGHAETFTLTPEQKKAVDSIAGARDGSFLLHGVTGSGKTEVYIRAIEALGDKEAIVLVPEIALTAQIIDRFRRRFPDSVAFFHSGLSPAERISQWWKIRNGEVRVAIGVRSAVFSPFRNLGLVVIDEEHETSYKQFEGLRYSARDVALARAKIEGVKIVLGSATPSVETYYHAQGGRLAYLGLRDRIEKKPMPSVEVIDMTKEDKASPSYSGKLLDVLKDNLSQRHQSLIMLNRRGYSPFFMCTDCGHTYKCPACSITLTYHKDTGTLNCHYCNSFLYPDDVCPACGGTRTKYLGLGTQRVEEELHGLIPRLSLKRMDRDSTRRKLSHYRIIKDMEAKKIDVLLGTQMVAKGHDFPDVTVAAVILADVALNLPDFRSSERTFQLFTQLAGRAGRGEVPGRVYIQTYEPGHYVFDFVRGHDYEGFYRREIESRKELSYPPFSKMARIVLSFRKKEDAMNIMKDVAKKIKRRAPFPSAVTGRIPEGKDRIEVLGPAPAPIEKIRNLWRWHLIVKGSSSRLLRQYSAKILELLKDIKGMRVDVDVDPVNLL